MTSTTTAYTYSRLSYTGYADHGALWYGSLWGSIFGPMGRLISKVGGSRAKKYHFFSRGLTKNESPAAQQPYPYKPGGDRLCVSVILKVQVLRKTNASHSNWRAPSLPPHISWIICSDVHGWRCVAVWHITEVCEKHHTGESCRANTYVTFELSISEIILAVPGS